MPYAGQRHVYTEENSLEQKNRQKSSPRVLTLYRTHELRENISSVLGQNDTSYLAYSPSSPRDICELSVKQDPDIILLETDTEDNGLSVIPTGRQLRLHTCAQLLLVSRSRDRTAVIQAGTQTFASGCVFPGQMPYLHDFIRDTWLGDTPQKILIRELILSSLTQAERKVLEILLGAPNDLLSSPKTIANQKTSIFHKLGLKNFQEVRHIFRNY